MAKFEINVEGIGPVPVFSGTVRRKSLSFLFRWKRLASDVRKGYVVILPGDKRYHLKRSSNMGWPSDNEEDMSRAVLVGKKWVQVETDETILKIRTAIDEFEKNES